jgi:hypothetical protein
MKLFLTGVLVALTGLSATQRPQTYTGTITDDICAGDAHAGMRMGPTDADCTRLCVLSHGAQYVLLDGKAVYTLSDQKGPEAFAGQKVRVVGTLDASTKILSVNSISAAD